MLEVEIKARGANSVMEHRLSDLGAVHLKDELHSDTYFNAPHRDFANTDEALRLRSVDGRTELTYKGSKLTSDSKSRLEYSTDVDPDEMYSILLALGFKKVAVVKKRRRVFELDDITLCVDNVDGVGEFIELERCVPDGDDVGEQLGYLFVMLEKLGLSKDDTTTVSYLEMLLESGDA